MKTIRQTKCNFQIIKCSKLIIASLLIGFLSAFLAISLKRMTEYYENIFFHQANNNPIYYLVFPFVGLSVIYFLRLYLFKRKENKGIKEIFESTNSESKNLPLYKIPSHFINGLLTVIFGGSTGIEVSTVVASATIGSVCQQKENIFKKYKLEFISAGVAAGITALFCSPFAGILFATEVISKKVTKSFFLITIPAITLTTGLLFLLNEPPLFALKISNWHGYAIPYFLLLGVLSGIHSVYLTKCVLYFKKQFLKVKVQYTKIIISVIILSTALFIFPELYGDGYHAIKSIIFSSKENLLTLPFGITLLGILLLKPIVTSATLASGGDGGVFAPSLFMGAFLGLTLSILLNTFFDTNLIPLNFIIIGMAASLSASIHAPFTALFLVCGIINDYTLFFPMLAICLVSKYTAKMIYPFTVYSFNPSLQKL
ncbi:MAG: chloride channel protein [Flavobacterium sp.]|nr:chloride channel protein [Flavobacterium sp.]